MRSLKKLLVGILLLTVAVILTGLLMQSSPCHDRNICIGIPFILESLYSMVWDFPIALMGYVILVILSAISGFILIIDELMEEG